MQIIFRPAINKNSLTFLAVVALFLTTLTVNAQECQPFSYQTTFTRCKISLDQCIPTPQSHSSHNGQSYFVFKSCFMQKCVRLGAGPDCHSFITMQLDERQCYRTCCKSSSFSANECDTNNISLKSKDETVNGYLAIVLSICALVLIIAAFCFITFQLRCFEGKKERIAEEVDVPVWRKMNYRDNKCSICDQYGSQLQTACQHSFHLQCYKLALGTEELEGQCVICEEYSRRFRLYCSECHESYLKVGFGQIKTGEVLEKFYLQSKGLHFDCMRDIQNYAKTDVRMTNSTE